MTSPDDASSAPRPQRGRKSAASLSLVPNVRQRRPPPPASLSVAERALWQEIVGAVRPDWFRGASEYLLEVYVRLLAQARDIAAALEEAEVGSDRYIDLVGLHRTVAMAAGNLAAKLRLTVRSTQDRYTPRAVSTAGVRPWEDDGSEPA